MPKVIRDMVNSLLMLSPWYRRIQADLDVIDERDVEIRRRAEQAAIDTQRMIDIIQRKKVKPVERPT